MVAFEHVVIRHAQDTVAIARSIPRHRSILYRLTVVAVAVARSRTMANSDIIFIMRVFINEEVNESATSSLASIPLKRDYLAVPYQLLLGRSVTSISTTYRFV